MLDVGIKSIIVDNVNRAVGRGLDYLLREGVQTTSRNGSVIAAPVPVCTAYRTPARRVLFSPVRNANPFFHLMEAIWMLAGRNDVAWPVKFAKNIRNYSDDEVTFWGAYGHRWRNWFGYDQLASIIEDLMKDKDSRRCVLGMWDPQLDPPRAREGGKDVPCNTTAYFRVVGDALNMTVCNRSNDLVWGAYGANAVHFSILHEFVARAVGLKQGVYYQVSNNLHVYTDLYPVDKLRDIRDNALQTDYYNDFGVSTYPLVNGTLWRDWLKQAEKFCEHPLQCDEFDPFFRDVAGPVYMAWECRARPEMALQWAGGIQAEDWRLACVEWLNRRAK